MAWTGEGSDAVVSAGSATGSPGFSFVSTRTGTVFTLIDVGAWSGHQRALKLRASKGMMWTLSLTTGVGARGARTRAGARGASAKTASGSAARARVTRILAPYDAGLTGEARTSRSLSPLDCQCGRPLCFGIAPFRSTFVCWFSPALNFLASDHRWQKLAAHDALLPEPENLAEDRHHDANRHDGEPDKEDPHRTLVVRYHH